MTSIVGPLFAGTLYYLLAAVSLFLTRGADNIATMWPPSGLLLATLLLTPPALAPRYLVAAAIGSMVANMTMGSSGLLALGFTVANITESTLAAWLLRRGADRLSFVDGAEVRRFCIVSAIAASASAALATLLSPPHSVDFFLSWFSTDLLGMLIVAPIIVIGRQLYDDRGRTSNSRSWIETVALIGAVALVSVGVFAQSSYPLLFLPMGGVLIAVFRLGPLGAAASVLTIALVSSVAVSLGHGPTALIEDAPTRIFFLQFYLVVLLAAALPVATLLASRDRLLVELLESNRLLDEARQVAEQTASTALCVAETDQLTGLPNRRKAVQVLEAHIGGGTAPLMLAILDIDHFKRVNDTYGHLVGDRVLQRVARDAAGTLRGADFIGRFGGEEFILVLPRTSVEHALVIAERVRVAVAAGGSPEGDDPRVTVSLGLASALPGERMEEILRRADAALYEAKEAGRDVFRFAA